MHVCNVQNLQINSKNLYAMFRKNSNLYNKEKTGERTIVGDPFHIQISCLKFLNPYVLELKTNSVR